MSAADLIHKLNPKIRGWANYHRHAVSKRTFGRVDHHIFSSLWQWARRRHPNKTAAGANRSTLRCIVVVTGPSSVKRVMTRGSPVKFGCGHARSTPIKRHVKVKGDANPYDPAYEPTSSNAKGLICSDYVSGNSYASLSLARTTRALHCVQYQNHSDHGLAPSPLRSPCDGWFAKRREPRSTSSRVP
jgi:hypothetical protein